MTNKALTPKLLPRLSFLFAPVALLLIMLFAMNGIFAQSIKLVDEGNTKHHVELNDMGNILSPIGGAFNLQNDLRPYFTNFLILNNGSYSLDSFDFETALHKYMPLDIGVEMNGNITQAYVSSSGRYSDPAPPEPTDEERLKYIQNTNKTLTNLPGSISSVVPVTLDASKLIHVDTNHMILKDKLNLYAISYNAVSSGHVYFFYGKKTQEGESIPTEFLQFRRKFQPIQAFYQDSLQSQQVSGTIERFRSVENFENVAIGDIAFKSNNRFNQSQTQFRTLEEAYGTNEKRMFIGLENDPVEYDQGEIGMTYEYLAVLCSNDELDDGITANINLTEKPGFEIVNNATEGTMTINSETVVDVILIQQKVVEPHDPNTLILEEVCAYCPNPEGNYMADKSPLRYRYSFQFCNEGTGEVAPPAKEAYVSITDLSNKFDCIQIDSSTVDNFKNGAWHVKGLNLKDLRITGNADSSCAKIYFDAWIKNTDPQIHTGLEMSACATFSEGGETVCDSLSSALCKDRDRRILPPTEDEKGQLKRSAVCFTNIDICQAPVDLCKGQSVDCPHGDQGVTCNGWCYCWKIALFILALILFLLYRRWRKKKN